MLRLALSLLLRLLLLLLLTLWTGVSSARGSKLETAKTKRRGSQAVSESSPAQLGTRSKTEFLYSPKGLQRPSAIIRQKK